MDPNLLCKKCGQLLTGHAVGGCCLKCLAALAFASEEEVLPAEGPEDQPREPAPTGSRLRYFGDYELIEEIARGGMGVVFKARQLSLGRIVAVKMLLSGAFTQKGYIERFRAEARAVANLQHPNIVAIHEIAEHDGQPYFSMDYVEGGHLGDLAGREALPATRAAAILQTIAAAVHYAHEHGVLHRDLKPSNILIDRHGQPRVTDFGLAKRMNSTVEDGGQGSGGGGQEAGGRRQGAGGRRQGAGGRGQGAGGRRQGAGGRGQGAGGRGQEAGVGLQKSEIANQNSEIELTLSGQALGTPHYMSPEQARGRRADITAATDIYSLGAMLFQLLARRPPFVADSFEGVLIQLRQDEPVPPRLLNPSIPRDLETICLKCLSKEPQRRYATARELADELGRFLRNEPIQARPVSKPERVWRWCRRHPLVSGLALALNVALALGLSGILWQWRRAEQHVLLETAQRMRAQEAVTSLELQRAEYLLNKDDIVMGMAYLARIVREQPTNHVAARRLLGALTQRNFALPFGAALQHHKKVNHAEFSPDGRCVVTASLDLSARVWDARTGEPLTPPMLHPNAVRKAHFSPDGTRVVTVADDFQARLWDAATGKALGEPMTHTKNIRRAKFSPDGRRILTASLDGQACLWDAQTGRAVFAPMTHQRPVRWGAFSPDGQRVVTASDDRTARIWDAMTGQPVGKPWPHSEGVDFAVFSPDGKMVVTAASDRSTWLWDMASGEVLGKTVQSAQIASINFSPDGQSILVALHSGSTRIFNAPDWKLLAGPMEHRSWACTAVFGPEGQRVLTGSLDHTARLWDAKRGTALSAPMQHHGTVWEADFGPDGLSVVTASADSTGRLWDVRRGEMRSQSISHASPVRAAEFSPDGNWALSTSDDGSARLSNTRTGLLLDQTLQHTSAVWLARFSPDGRRVATGSHDGTARIWDARTGLPISAPLPHKAIVRALEFSPNGQWLASGSANGWVNLWDAHTGQPKGQPIPLRGSSVTCLRFSPDSQSLLSSDYKDDLLELRDVATGRLLAQSPEREGAVLHADFSPDGRSLATASTDGQVWIWDAQTLQPRIGPLLHLDSACWVRFSADGQRIVTASEDTTAQVWDAHTGKPAGDPMRHLGPVYIAEFSPDGSLVLTASADGTARLWDAAAGRPVAEPFRHAGIVYSARFSPDGRRVITASHDGSAYLWDVPPLPSQHPGLLLADLAEAVLGKRVNAQGALENVPPGSLGQIRQRIVDLPLDSDFARWMHWFCADRSTRMISPYSQISLPDYIAARAQQTNEAAWREALMFCPTNGMAFAQMALHHLRKHPAPGSQDLALADWASRQAVKFAPLRQEPWQRRVEATELGGQWAQLLAEAEQAIQSNPGNVSAWNAKARALLQLGQSESRLQYSTDEQDQSH